MTMDGIRKKYNVPAKRGMKIKLEDDMEGIIVGSQGLYLRVRVLGKTGISTYHPTWHIKYPNNSLS